MASFTVSAAIGQPKLSVWFPSTPQISSIPSLKLFSPFRCKSSGRLQINHRPLIVSAINPNSTGGKPLNEGSDVKETRDAAQGPPLLTILAGLFVFFLVCWTTGSIIMWLISLIVNAPIPK
ncbi:hypothetical protein TanjilG_20206 [Lupinus angustifolius]|uniref:Uncharacterized protein n=1 Tax=Lupinus angustifolius TaxID=3871 RepID=A0A1J7HZB6_LUPAN|nr:PREDICTED: uncharacterized protein LOC109347954 [Lupinus angustifolius]OIW11722.1 hypothetical protein TanjilG_20206 [Lupinus angustifolius]